MKNKFLPVTGDVHSNADVFEYLAKITESPDCLAFLYAGDEADS